MNKINCNIIRDLLPSYIDKLTSNESNELIEAHLTECADCKELISTLSQTVQVDTKEANREIDYLKKIKAKRRKMLRLTVIVCTVIFCAISAIGIKTFVIGSPVAYHAIDTDKTDNFVGIGSKFNPETNELTIYGEILSNRKAFSSVKVEEAKGLVNAYNITVYAAQRFSDTSENSRKFECVIKVPNDNKDWSFYSVGKIPQDTQLVWTNHEYLNEKTASHLQKLTNYLTAHNIYSEEESFLERHYFQSILSDPCYMFFLTSKTGVIKAEYAVSEDCERIYYYDAEKEMWLQF